MVCKNCGNPIAESQKFCTACGTPVEQPVEAAVTEEPVAEAPVEAVAEPVAEPAEPAAEAPAEEASQAVAEEAAQPAGDFVEMDIEEVLKPKKKRKKALFISLGAAAVAIAAAVAVFLNFSFLSGLWIKTFGTDQQYLAHVETSAANAAIDSMTEFYGAAYGENAKETATGKGAISTQLEVDVDQEALDTLAAALDTEVDLSFINDLSLKSNLIVNGKWASVDTALLYAGEQLLSGDVILNQDMTELFVGIPELSDTYLDLSEMLEQAKTEEQLSQEDLAKMLPEEKVLNALLKKYVKLVFDNIEDVSAEEDTVKIDGVEQKLTVLEYKIDADTMANILEAVLEEAKEDKDIEAIITNFVDVLVEKELLDEDEAEGVYDEFQDGIEEALDSLDELRDDESGSVIILRDYVDGAHQIVGRALAIRENKATQELFHYITVKNGAESAVEVEFGEIFFANKKLVFSGSGKVEKNLFNATYALTLSDMKLMELTIADFDVKTAKAGYYNGKITLSPSEGLFDWIEQSGESLPEMINEKLALEFVFQGKDKTQVEEMRLVIDGKAAVTLKLTVKEEEVTEITKPGTTLEAEGEDDLVQWTETFNVDKLQQKLEKAGLWEILEQLTAPKDEELILGEWTCEVAGSDFGYDLNEMVVGNLGDAAQYFEFSDMTFTFNFSFYEDGTLDASVNQESLNETMQTVVDEFVEGYINYMEAEAEALYGMSLDELLEAENMTRQEFVDLCYEQFSDVFEENFGEIDLDAFEELNYYALSEGKLYISDSEYDLMDEENGIAYTLDETTLTVDNDGVTMVFKK